MILMSLILFLGVGLIGGVIIGIPLLIVGAPAMMGVVAGTSDALRNGMLVSGLLFLVYLPVLILLSGILRSYTTSAWTLTYLRLTTKPSQSLIDASSLPEDLGTPPEQNI
jgi:ABC-type transport system involved in cytochrome c biogenesis permease component